MNLQKQVAKVNKEIDTSWQKHTHNFQKITKLITFFFNHIFKLLKYFL